MAEFRIHLVNAQDADVLTYLLERDTLQQVRKAVGSRFVQKPDLVPDDTYGMWIEPLEENFNDGTTPISELRFKNDDIVEQLMREK